MPPAHTNQPASRSKLPASPLFSAHRPEGNGTVNGLNPTDPFNAVQVRIQATATGSSMRVAALQFTVAGLPTAICDGFDDMFVSADLLQRAAQW